MSTLNGLLLACLACSSPAPGMADPSPPGPDARISLSFPGLPNTLAGMVAGRERTPTLDAILPRNYAADRKFPLFVYLKGGSGGPEDAGRMARAIIGEEDFIAVSMPLFKKSQPPGRTLPVTAEDLPVLREAYRAMLGALLAAVPNVDPERSVIGGHSNGAHTLGVLLEGGDDFILDHFRAFYFHEGGLQAFTPEVLGGERARRSRFLLLVGDAADEGAAAFRRSMAGRVRAIEARAREGSIDLKVVTMRGYGHDVPPESMRNVRQFARGEPIEDIVGTEKALAAALPRPPRTHPDPARWNDLLVDDLTNMRFPGGSWAFADGVLSAKKDGLIWTKATHGDFAIDLEFRLGPGADGGLLLYNSDVEAWGPNSVEIQLSDDEAPRHRDRPATERTGAFLGHQAPARSAVKPAGLWNRLTVVAQGPEVAVILNDQVVNEIDLRRFEEAGAHPAVGGATPAASAVPWSRRPYRGRIGLRSSHGESAVEFRGLKLLHLKEPPAP